MTDLYSSKESIFHNWDYRFKVLSLFLFIFGSTALNSFIGLFTILALSLVSLLFSKLKLSSFLKILSAPIFFLVFMALILCITSGGETLITFGPINIYTNGLKLSAIIILRSVSIIIIFTILFGSTRFQDLFNAFHFFKVPPIFVSILLFTWRYIFLYLEELSKLFTAAKQRGFSLIKGVFHIKETANLLTTLLIKSFEQSERVKAAMTCRGYSGSFHFTKKHSAKFSDFALSFFFLVSIASVIIFESWKT